jgi:hypothetical protein
VQLTRRKKIAFALAAMSLAVFGTVAMLLVVDLVLHHRAERSAGLNRYGYRGPVAGRKQAGELRIVMLGGSTVFGYGVSWNESSPVRLEARLRQRMTGPVTVINLGFNSEGAFAFVPNLEDFADLDYDVIVLYEGYNDIPGDEGVNRNVYRRDSAVFRLTGYYPILPLYLEEKARMLRYGSDLSAGYEIERQKERGLNPPVTFNPNLAQRTGANALDALAVMTKALNGQFENAAVERPPAIQASQSTLGCDFPHVTYCESMAAAIRFGVERGKTVVVATQPLMADGRGRELHALQHTMLAGMMANWFAADPRIVFADLSTLIDLQLPAFTFDGMHLTPEGNDRIAASLVEPVIAAAAARH